MDKLTSLNKEQILKYGLHLAILVGVIVAALRYLNGQDVLNALRDFNYRLAPFILLLATAYLLIKAWRFVLLIAPFDDGVPRLVTFKAYVAGQAATLLPGGVAARAGLLKQVDVPLAKSSVPVVFSSGIDQVVFIVGSLIAALWFEAARTPAVVLLGLIAVALVIALIPALRRRFAGAVDWAATRVNAKEEWQEFIEAVPQIFTWRIMLPASALTLVAFTTKVVALDLSMRGVGLNLAYPTLLLGFILPTMLGRMAPVPGGVGVTEATMVGFLASTTQAGPNQLTAAVAIFRIGTIFFQALLGAIVYFVAWDGSDEATAEATA